MVLWNFYRKNSQSFKERKYFLQFINHDYTKTLIIIEMKYFLLYFSPVYKFHVHNTVIFIILGNSAGAHIKATSLNVYCNKATKI